MGAAQRMLVALLCVGLCACMLKFEKAERDGWEDPEADTSGDMGGEIPESTCEPIFEDLRIGPTTTDLFGVDLLWTGVSWAAVWKTVSPPGDILITTIDASGDFVNREMTVTDSPGEYDDARVAWTGSEYGVVWTWDGRDVGFSTLSADGSENGTDTLIAHLEDESMATDIVWTGSEFVVTWESNMSGHEVMASRILRSGEKVGSDITIDSGPGGDGRHVLFPQAVWTGSETGLLWRVRDETAGHYSLHAQRLSPAGELLEIPQVVAILSGTCCNAISFLWDGTQFVAIYTDPAGDATTKVQTIAPDGTPSGTAMDVDFTGEYVTPMDFVHTGWVLAVVWNDMGECWFDRLTIEGHLHGDAYLIDGAGEFSHLAEEDGTFAVLHSGSEDGEEWALFMRAFNCE